MIDRREPPALAAIEPVAGDAPPLAPRLSGRIAWILGAAAVLAALTAFLGMQMVGYVHHLATYRLAFRDIELEPSAPGWIPGGSAGLLESLRDRSGLPESLSPETDLEKLRQDFRHCPWVEDVGRIRRPYRNRLVIPLRYREPVAAVKLDAATIVLDRDGVVLPDILDPRGLIEVAGLDPIEARHGLRLKARAPEGVDPGEPPRAAARLADFLRAKQANRPDSAFRVRSIYFKVDANTPRAGTIRAKPAVRGFLWLVSRRSVRFCWGEVPEPLSAETPSAERRWELLQAWARHPGVHRIDDPSLQWLKLEGGEIRVLTEDSHKSP